MKKSLLKMFSALSLMVCGAGCAVQFADCGHISPYDDAVDEANAAFVKQARDTYEARKNFRCDVELKPAESVNVFLSHASHRNFSVADKRDLLLLLENTLAERMGALRDFNLVNRGAAVGDVTTEVSAGTGKSSNYRMTYSIVNMAIRERQVVDELASLSRQTMVSKRVFYGTVKVEIGLYDPTGRQVFVFNEECASGNSDRRELSLLKNAVESAVSAAVRKYSMSTMPPVYVAQTVGGGTYAQISGGSAYGIASGMRIRFYRNELRKQPALPGEKAEVKAFKVPVGRGVAGVFGAPIDADSAWVYLDRDFRNPEMQSQRTVFVWTSAEPEQ